jgi:threonine aldolase
LDGARVFNAAVALGVTVSQLAQPFDTVSVCLSKGLGTPVGSVLVGSSELIAKGRRLRKMLGGTLRQVGILAAAGLYALDHNVERLADDHANAKALAQGLAKLPGLKVVEPDTNIVFVDVEPRYASGFADHLAQAGIGMTSAYGATRQRWVTHLDVDKQAVDAALAAATDFFARHA